MRATILIVLLACLPFVFARIHHAHQEDVIDSTNIDAVFAQTNGHHQLSAHEQFAQFKRTYNKKYASHEVEAHRFVIFQENLKRAAELNKKIPTATFGVTKFSDLHPVEFKRQYLNFIPAVGDAAVLRARAPLRKPKRVHALPAAFDWRKPGAGKPVAVTAVKDQGQCGSCWAFSATEGVESAHIMAGGKPVVLAPEQTVDCDTVDQGCNGGDLPTAFAYMEQAGVQTEASYPYTAGDSGNAGTCVYNGTDVAVRISGFTYATPNCSDTCTHQDEKTLQQNLYESGPVSICVDASVWQTYSGGILTPDSGCSSAYTSLDHCVQLVGYGVDSTSGQKYWSVRNSWGLSGWGEQGYIRLSYGTNTCGVADEATQVQVA